MSFSALRGVQRAMAARLDAIGMVPSAVQRLAIPGLSSAWAGERGSATLVRARTGTGKTLAYLLPALQLVAERRCRGIVVVPTPEIAQQVLAAAHAVLLPDEEAGGGRARALLDGSAVPDAGRFRDRVLVAARGGGLCDGLTIATPRVAAGEAGACGVATPGSGRPVGVVVADEAELVMRPLRRYATARERTNRERHPKPGPELVRGVWRGNPGAHLALVSATGGAVVKDQAHRIMLECFGRDSGARVGVLAPPEDAAHSVSATLTHRLCVIPPAEGGEKLPAPAAAAAQLVAREGFRRALVVVRVGEGAADRAVAALGLVGVPAARLGGDALERFRRGELPALVATEESVRGLHVEGLEHVVLCDPTPAALNYAHVAGRCGRGGLPGTAWTVARGEDAQRLAAVFELIGISESVEPQLL